MSEKSQKSPEKMTEKTPEKVAEKSEKTPEKPTEKSQKIETEEKSQKIPEKSHEISSLNPLRDSGKNWQNDESLRKWLVICRK